MDGTQGSMEDRRRDPRTGPGQAGAGGFGQVLVVVDQSIDGMVAAAYAAALARQFGGTVAMLEVAELKARQRRGGLVGIARSGQGATACTVAGPTAGTRGRELAEQIARAARQVGAEVIVLGLERTRLARHRVAPSLRSLLAHATEVPVLLAPPSHTVDGGCFGGARPDIDPLGAEHARTRQRGRFAGV